MKNQLQAICGIILVSAILTSCSATKTSLQATAITSVHKQAQSSDSSNVKKSEIQISNVDTGSTHLSRSVTLKDSAGNDETIKVDSGTLLFGNSGRLMGIKGKGILFTKSKAKVNNKTWASSDDSSIARTRNYMALLLDSTKVDKSKSYYDSLKLAQLKYNHSSTPVFTWIWAFIAPFAVPGAVILGLFILIGIVVIVKKQRKAV